MTVQGLLLSLLLLLLCLPVLCRLLPLLLLLLLKLLLLLLLLLLLVLPQLLKLMSCGCRSTLALRRPLLSRALSGCATGGVEEVLSWCPTMCNPPTASA